MSPLFLLSLFLLIFFCCCRISDSEISAKRGQVTTTICFCFGGSLCSQVFTNLARRLWSRIGHSLLRISLDCNEARTFTLPNIVDRGLCLPGCFPIREHHNTHLEELPWCLAGQFLRVAMESILIKYEIYITKIHQVDTYGHTIVRAPHPVWSAKLSTFWPG